MKAQELIKILEIFPDAEVYIKNYRNHKISEISVTEIGTITLKEGKEVEEEE